MTTKMSAPPNTESLADIGTFAKPGWTPRETAQAYAVARHRIADVRTFKMLGTGDDLLAEFRFVDGNATYLVFWRGDPRYGHYRVGRIIEGGREMRR